MIFRAYSVAQYIIMAAFATIFISGAIYLSNDIFQINETKSHYPILVYTNTLDDAINVINYATDSEVFLAYHITFPDSLESMLIRKYNLVNYHDISSGYSLPYQVEIYIQPHSMDKLALFVSSMTARFSNDIVHYNASLWREIDQQANLRSRYYFILLIVSLLLYVLLMHIYRLRHAMKNVEIIQALKNSGMTPRKLKSKENLQSCMFILISVGFIIVINFIINFFELFAYITQMHIFHTYYINPNAIYFFTIFSFLYVVTQPSMFSQKR
jgi:hypothetical protein